VREYDESRDVLKQLKTWVADDRMITSVAVCRDGDSASLACALNIVTALHPATVPIHVRMSQETGLADLLEEGTGPGDWMGKIHPFGMTNLNATRSILLDRKRDILARAFHRNYVHERRCDGLSPDSPGLKDWDDLSVDLQDSNRQMADHLWVKLRALWDPDEEGQEVARLSRAEAGDIDLLARMEHARWCAERFIAGWEFGETDHDRKTHADLVPWEKLGENSQDYDRQAVLCIPGVLKLIEDDDFSK